MKTKSVQFRITIGASWAHRAWVKNLGNPCTRVSSEGKSGAIHEVGPLAITEWTTPDPNGAYTENLTTEMCKKTWIYQYDNLPCREGGSLYIDYEWTDPCDDSHEVRSTADLGPDGDE